jgi:hypothetical protein
MQSAQHSALQHYLNLRLATFVHCELTKHHQTCATLSRLHVAAAGIQTTREVSSPPITVPAPVITVPAQSPTHCHTALRYTALQPAKELV